ncbi:MAG: M20/M25/M40 family metallo-hydrolase [Gemmatimonadetes bacterium]|nr:M20/M25/M40 family metallo-hydrolase [Gemmatimonadota bacterium]
MSSSQRLLLAAFLAAAPLGAQQPTTPAMTRRLLSALADDSMQGRATGTPGARRAATLIAAEMKRIGLEPAGDSGYFQRVPVVQGDSVKMYRRERVPDPQDPSKGSIVRVDSSVFSWRAPLRVLATLTAYDSAWPARRRPAVNVVGVLRGSDPSLQAEHILIDAHYDHLGMRTPAVAGGDSIYNGADDDASGVTAVLEIARQLAHGPKPRRTVVFAATIGEEVGLLGTNWYIAHPALPLSGMVANLEIEMIGRPDSLAGGSGRAWLTGYERSTMGDMLAANGVPIGPDKRPDQQFFQRSDNIAFARRGIVAHTLSTYNLHTDYHQVTDDVSRVDFAHMAGVINAAAKAARLLADGAKPEWKPGGKPEVPPGRMP